MVTAEDMLSIASEAGRIAGLAIRPEQGAMIESRLSGLARAEGYESVNALIGAMKTRKDAKLTGAAVEALAGRDTWFFRQREQYDLILNEMLPVLARARGRRNPIRIWSAGCSTGQEAYSLAMMLAEETGHIGDLEIEIVGTDISRRAIERARAGAYSQFDVQRGLSIHRLVKHFEQSGKDWRLKTALRSMVRFEQGNLLTPPEDAGMFDIILCRNVLTALTPEARKRVIANLSARCAEDGYLLMGEGEAAYAAGPFRAVRGQKGVLTRPEVTELAA
ncbi:MAG: methyltransferase domain-containing protein [Alphaproteobacteria bacterium]|nr:methyltransferase domain-containing protein [Alphaproteobacteria bacterium]